MGIVIRTHGNEAVPTGEYQVVLLSLEVVETPDGDELEWTFMVLHNGRKIVQRTTISGEFTSKCMEWSMSLMQTVFAPNEEVNLTELVGKTAIAHVKLCKRNGREYNRIEKLLPDW